MKTTVTEEYEDGQLVRRTTVTDGERATGGYVGREPLPNLDRGCVLPFWRSCSCGQPWSSVTPPPPCPVHGQAQPVTITCSSDTSPKELAAQVAWDLRRMA